MKVLSVTDLPLPGVKVVRFARFRDARGYFTESFRRTDLLAVGEALAWGDAEIVQVSESRSRRGTIRGMHFQWNPFMGKLVRTMAGHMVDLVLDLRRGSPTHGAIIAHDMPHDAEAPEDEWIWVPPGFGHGNFFPEESAILYLCTGEYSQGCEACVSPLSPDLDWSRCDPALRRAFLELAGGAPIITDKDRHGHTLASWTADARSEVFVWGEERRWTRSG